MPCLQKKLHSDRRRNVRQLSQSDGKQGPVGKRRQLGGIYRRRPVGKDIVEIPLEELQDEEFADDEEEAEEETEEYKDDFEDDFKFDDKFEYDDDDIDDDEDDELDEDE